MKYMMEVVEESGRRECDEVNSFVKEKENFSSRKIEDEDKS